MRPDGQNENKTKKQATDYWGSPNVFRFNPRQVPLGRLMEETETCGAAGDVSEVCVCENVTSAALSASPVEYSSTGHDQFGSKTEKSSP